LTDFSSPYGKIPNYILEVKGKMEFAIKKFSLLSLEMWDCDPGG
jgi:hypothetical protein